MLDLSEEHGLLEADSTVVVGRLELLQLVERPLVLKSLTTLRAVCGTLRPAAPITTYVASFVANLAGKMVFRQVRETEDVDSCFLSIYSIYMNVMLINTKKICSIHM